MKGWVYVITNKAMPDIVKVGFSTKDPEIRAQELYHTGSPHVYVVAYNALVDQPFDIEQRTHSHLRHCKEGKEWFRCSVEYAVAALREVIKDGIYLEELKAADQEKIAEAVKLREAEEAAKPVKTWREQAYVPKHRDYQPSITQLRAPVEHTFFGTFFFGTLFFGAIFSVILQEFSIYALGVAAFLSYFLAKSRRN